MKKYVVGYDTEQGFVVLCESDSMRTAMTMRRKYADRRTEEIKVKKRLTNEH